MKIEKTLTSIQQDIDFLTYKINDYQAKDFYLKHGYDVFGVLKLFYNYTIQSKNNCENDRIHLKAENVMPDLPSALQAAIDSAHTPAVSYAYIEPDAQHPGKFASTSIAVGKKKSTDPKNTVEDDTRFPASSLSKVVFAYLVLQVAKDKKNDFDLDTPLLPMLPAGQEYVRFEKVNGQYPDKAQQLTARDVLSHTTGLPNFSGPTLAPTLKFDESPLGTGYLYSGESFLFLQTVLEAKTGKNLEELAKKYVFGYDLALMSSLPEGDLKQAKKDTIYLSENPRMYYLSGMKEAVDIPEEIDLRDLEKKLTDNTFKTAILDLTSKAGYTYPALGMSRSTFQPQPEDPNTVMVHTKLEEPRPISAVNPTLCAAGSLLTTANDFAKFMNAWLEQMDDPIIKQAFDFETSTALSALTSEEFHRLISDDNTKTYLKNATNSNYRRVPFSKTELDELKRAIGESTQTETRALSAKLVSEPTRTYRTAKTCGLGWHIYKDADKVIAYQFGENDNTRSFTAINVTDKKGAVFFTNSENGMKIANLVFNSSMRFALSDLTPEEFQRLSTDNNTPKYLKNATDSNYRHVLFNQTEFDELKRAIEASRQTEINDLSVKLVNSPALPPIGDMREIYKEKKYTQIDEPGYQETMAGMRFEEQGHVEEARRSFKLAAQLAPHDESKRQRLEWFNKVHPAEQPTPKQTFNPLPESFVGKFVNKYKDEVEISTGDDGLIYNGEFGQKIKLVQVSDNEFLPEKNQSFKISFLGGQMKIFYVQGGPSKDLQPLSQFQLEAAVDSTEKPTLAAQPSAAAVPQAQEKMQSFKARIPHEPPDPAADTTKDKRGSQPP